MRSLTDTSSLLWPAPAKLNLFLHITGRRSDGYHELQTLFQLIDLHDELEITPTEDRQVIRLSGHAEIPQEEDLVVRAAKLLQSECRVSGGVRIRVNKNIPLGGGLGGGSSDAATTLLVLNQAWSCNLSLKDLAELGLSLGADVPVFVQGQSALATGVGEQLEALELGERHYVLVFLPVHVNTGEVFRAPQLRRDCELISRKAALAGKGINVCEPVVRRLHPIVDKALDGVGQFGPVRMTGTGSTLFLEMPDRNAAMKATHELKSLYNVRAVRGQDRSMVHEMLHNQSWTGRGWQSAGTSPRRRSLW